MFAQPANGLGPDTAAGGATVNVDAAAVATTAAATTPAANTSLGVLTRTLLSSLTTPTLRRCGLCVYAAARRERLRLAPAAEDEAAEGEAEAERADAERADREHLAPRRQTLPAAERLRLLGRQRLAAALLAERAAGAEAEVEVVEDLGGLFCFRHGRQCIACHPPCPSPFSTSPTSISARVRTPPSSAPSPGSSSACSRSSCSRAAT